MSHPDDFSKTSIIQSPYLRKVVILSATWREWKRQRLKKTGVIYQKKKGVVKASYEVALLVAKNMKAFTIDESISGNALQQRLGLRT